MSSVANEILQDRRQTLIGCNRVAKEALSFSTSDLSAQIDPKESVEDRYWKFLNFARSTVLAGPAGKVPHVEGASLSGFSILTEILSRAPHEYQKYCRERYAVPYLGELNAALKRSQETPGRLLGMSAETNNETEIALGLRTGYGAAESSPFRFEETVRGPLFIIDDDIFHAATSVPQGGSELPEHWQFCPGRRFVLRRIWPAMVDLATDTPEIFAQDLGMLDTGSYV